MDTMLRPARATPPGRIIERELEARGWSQKDLAEILDRPEQVVSEIIRAKKQITPETARQLGSAFGTSPDFWLNLEMQFQLHQSESREKDGEIECRSRLYDLAPVKELIKRRWIDTSDSIDDLEKRIKQFFTVCQNFAEDGAFSGLRVSNERGPEMRSIKAWLCRAGNLAEAQPVAKFNKENLSETIQQLLSFSSTDADVHNIPDLLIENGIHFITIPHLPKTYLDGAAFWLNDHPVVALSLRYDRIDYFWFTLLHELAHIVKQPNKTYLDEKLDQPVQGEDEQMANQQASEWLIPSADLDQFIDCFKPRFTLAGIEAFAEEHNRHPGIIVGQLMYKKAIDYRQFRECLVKVNAQLEMWEDVPVPY